MSDQTDGHDTAREQLADAFDTDSDPLATHAPTFETLDVDPFAVFLTETLPAQDPASGTVRGYRRVIDQWQTYMEQRDRHPACPSDHHVEGFVEYCRGSLDNRTVTIETKLRRLRYILSSWQLDPVFPHHEGYNPFNRVLEHTDFSREPTKEPPRLPVETLRSILGGISQLRDRVAGFARDLGSIGHDTRVYGRSGMNGSPGERPSALTSRRRKPSTRSLAIDSAATHSDG